MVKDFEINVSPTYSYNIIYPIDRSLKRNISIKNTGDEAIKLRYNFSHLEGVGGVGITKNYYSPSISLESGESKLIWLIMDEPQIFGEQLGGDKLVRQKDEYLGVRSIEEMEGEYPITVEVNVFQADDESKKKTVILKHLFRVVPPKKLENTSVSGHVYDEMGKLMNGVQVTLRGRSGIYRPTGKTNENGYYEIPCHSYNIHTYHTYNYQLEIEEPGYEFYHRTVEPILGGSITCNVNLEKTEEEIEYSLVKKIRLDMGVYRGDLTKDDKYIALGVGYWVEGIGYWSKITGRKPKSMHIYVFDIEGNIIWKYPMKGEVWGIDISDDGEYVAACCLGDPEPMYAGGDTLDGKENVEILLFNKRGELQWKTPQPGYPREVRISPNNKYVAVGERGGDTYFYDIKGNLLWKKQEEEITFVTQIYFSGDSSKIFVGTQPDLFSYDIDGNLLWRTNIGSWPYHTDGMNISEDGTRIVTSGKTGELRYLDGDGNILFAYEMDGHGRWAWISPDKSFAVAAMVGQDGTVMFDEEGKVHWRKDATDNGMVAADSKHILASMRSIILMNLNGTVVWSYPTNVSTRFCRITKDMSRIVAADDNGYVYFFKKKE